MKCIYCFNEISEGDKCSFCGSVSTEYSPLEVHLPAGTVIGGRYELGAVIGEGGFGITYAAYDRVLKSRCAVKEYFPKQFSVRNRTENQNTYVRYISNGENDFKNGLEKFKREASRLAAFDGNRNVVNVKDYISENNTGYIIMNFVEGVSLKEYVINCGGRLSCEKVLEMMKPLIDTLGKIHRTGLIHRDINPDNIMITSDEKPVLIDFGAAREYDTDKSMSVVLTQGFAPPEQYSSQGNQGPWTDIYSLCAVMYMLVTGAVPADSMDRFGGAEKLEKISAYGVRIPTSAEKAILKGLAVNPEDRWQSAQELYDALYEKHISKVWKIIVPAVAAAGMITAAVFMITGSNGRGAAVSDIQTDFETVTEISAEEITEETIEETAEIPVQEENEPEKNSLKAGGIFAGGSWTLTNDGVLSIKAEGMLNAKNAPWEEYKTDVTAVVLSDGIMEIGDKAFYRMTKLESAVLPDRLKSIGNTAFAGTGLKKIDIPDSVEYVGEEAFMNCEMLADVKLPSEIERIEHYCFQGCISLEKIEFPDTVSSLGASCFYGTGLKELTLPANFMYASNGGFAECDQLEKVIFPKGFSSEKKEKAYIPLDFISGKSLRDIYFEEGITAESVLAVAPYICSTADGFCNIHLADDMNFENIVLNEFSSDVTFVGESTSPAMHAAAELLQSVKITDNVYPDVYLNEKTLYINSMDRFAYRSFGIKKIEGRGLYKGNMTYNEYRLYEDTYTACVLDYFKSKKPSYSISVSVKEQSIHLGAMPHIDIMMKEKQYMLGANIILSGSVIVDNNNDDLRDGLSLLDERIFLEHASDALKKAELAVFGEGITSIGHPLSADCKNIGTVFIPGTVTHISDDAFDHIKLEKLCTDSPQNTYLKDYAEAHELEFEIVDSAEDIEV